MVRLSFEEGGGKHARGMHMGEIRHMAQMDGSL